MLMSLPNSVGIDPASANEDVVKASGRLVYKTGKMSKRGRTVQFVAVKIKLSQVDELAEFSGD
jgi:hypothetical protein